MANWIKTIDNDVKEKYKTSPPQTCEEKGIPINRDFLLTCLPAGRESEVMDLAILRIFLFQLQENW
jgi:hypothetical protein